MNDFEYWSKNILDKKIQKQLQSLNDSQKEDNFAGGLEFGTAGMRGVMQLGTLGMNELTVCKLAYATANYLQKFDNKSAVVCFDTRNNSKKFSKLFAKVLLAFNVDVYLFKEYAPTPLCVYMTTKYNTTIGVMITASHNNKTFNGIKIYDSNGIQINDATQQEISKVFNELNEVDVYNQIYNQRVQKKPVYIKTKEALEFVNDKKSDDEKLLKVIYTPLNGTGLKYVDKILKQNKYKYFVPSTQKNGNGEFLTCPYPNPEFVEAFVEAIKLAKQKDGDIIIATDPDADRIGVMAKHNGEYVKLTGNEVAYVFAEYLIETNKADNRYVVTSVVTSPLLETMCKANNVEFHKTLTGFLSLGTKGKELWDKYGKENQLLICEESCGYVIKNTYFDKDGIYSTLMLCDIAEKLKRENKTLVDYLDDIYKKYGYLETIGDSVKYDGVNSKQIMNNAVDNLRSNPPKVIDGEGITEVVDYLNDNTGLKKQNFLKFSSQNITFIIRPSGTEPKLKIYLFVKGNSKKEAKDRSVKVLEEVKLFL